MAFRIYSSVTRGEISNEVPGLVTGTLWLLGRSEPLELALRGNCHADLAGCKLSFKNPNPRPEMESPSALEGRQIGHAGDITASRKVRDVSWDSDGMPVVSDQLVNSLYLEWYSEANGRVLIEATDYIMTVSDPTWRLSQEQHASQAEERLDTFVSYLRDKIDQLDPTHDIPSFIYDEDDDENEQWIPPGQDYTGYADDDERDDDDEIGPEDSDQLDQPRAAAPPPFDAPRGIGRNYLDEPPTPEDRKPPPHRSSSSDAEWNDQRERLSSSEDEDDGDFEYQDSPEEFEEWLRALTDDAWENDNILDMDTPPMNEFDWEQELRSEDVRAEVYQEAFDKLKDHPERDACIAEIMGWPGFEHDEDEEAQLLEDLDVTAIEIEEAENLERHPLTQTITNLLIEVDRGSMMLPQSSTDDFTIPLLAAQLMSVGSKLAGSLDLVAQGFDIDPGYVVAMLKRAQVPINQSLHSLSCLDQRSHSPEAKAWVQKLRAEIFAVRCAALDIMSEMRNRSHP